MRENAYGGPEKESSVSREGRQGQALRIMEALSGVDGDLLERCEGGQEVPSHNRHIGIKAGAGEGGAQGLGASHKKRKAGKPRWKYAKQWAAVLCLAVVGALGWGGYKLALRVNGPGTGDSMGGTEAGIEAIIIEDNGKGAAGEEGGAVQAAEDNAALKGDGQEGGEGTGVAGKGAVDGNSSPVGIPENSGAQQPQDSGAAREEKESGMADSAGCLAAGQQKLTEEEARSKEKLGAYIPDEIPQGYVFESAYTLERQEANLTVVWAKGMDTIIWSVVEEEEIPQTVDIDAPETYDERLYEIPFSETVPQEYRQSVDNPTFAWEEFTQEAVRSRILPHTDSGDTDTPRGNFSVLYPDNVVVIFNGRVTEEEAWAMFESLPDS